jgi:hypothetical protein
VGLTGLLFDTHGSRIDRVKARLQAPFSLAFPTLTLVSLNLFSKLTFNGLTGLEQIAVFASETRGAARSTLRSACVAAPAIAVMYIAMSGSMLTYTAAVKIDLIGPIPQALVAASSKSR